MLYSRSGVPNLFVERDQFCERQIFHRLGVGEMVSDLPTAHLLLWNLAPNRPWTGWYQSMAWGLGSPAAAGPD